MFGRLVCRLGRWGTGCGGRGGSGRCRGSRGVAIGGVCRVCQGNDVREKLDMLLINVFRWDKTALSMCEKVVLVV